MNKEIELRKAKRMALLFLGGAALLFVLTLFLPRVWWAELLAAFSEAAMVGALADWFAVVALFKRVPIPFVSRHTEIIPANKEKIADNLAAFVRDKFLDTESVVRLIRRHDPAAKLAGWLILPENTARLGRYLVRLGAGMLDVVEDVRIGSFISKAVHSVIGSVDLSPSAGVILEGLTRNGRHQALLDEAINQFASFLRDEETQGFIAQGIVDWMKEEHPLKERVLPSEWIGRKGADLAVRAVYQIVQNIGGDTAHPVRQRFNRFVEGFVERLKTDPAFIEKGEEIKRFLQNDDTLNTYLKALWGDLRDWLKEDLEREDSVLHQRVEAGGQWLGKVLADDPQLRQSLNEHLETAVRGAAPDFAQFLTEHIALTVKDWDSRQMSEQIELNIGKDLQFIRINGTVVGGLIGVALYLIAGIPGWLARGAGAG